MRYFNTGGHGRLILILSFLITGCAANSMYRTAYDTCQLTANVDCNTHSLQQHTDKVNGTEYLLGFVEIDDQGQWRDRKQMQALIDTLYASAAKQSVLINVFVHGWHHNAAPGDSNIEGFKQVLARISHAESKKIDHKQQRKVIGVYVGWRGESILIPGIKNLTFWDRKNTAQDIGYLGITELLLKLEEIANVRNAIAPPIKSRLIVIGHSFGGAVVYSATSQILMSRFVDSQANKGFVDTAKGFGDLVVLLNPAFEALRYAPAFDLAQSRCSFFENQTPKLAILTSETDNATGVAFPLGRTLNTFFESHSKVNRNDCGYAMTLDEGEADRNTVGHYLPLVSHTLTPLRGKNIAHVVSNAPIKNIWSQQKSGGSTQFGQTVLTHLKKTVPRSPYLNIRVDKALMDGHNDIFRPEVDGFIDLLIQMSTVD
ncbi:Esterase/lipase/thioesterase family lipase [Crenothrix polyspora]|uniref:Esterase/lipase/thioesterase family lipase n=2 Tax=Crenothrix polyspora TaxID=360316 RepID=A0A1R4H8Z6_9GAMM|nr:Esterase/lipase/thioesterase family lipase [Crenothrix polyspora]